MRTALVAVVLASGTIPHNALGCSKHGTNAGNDIGVSAAVGGLAVAGEIIVPDNLVVVPTQPTTCVSGIGLGSTAQPLPPGFEVTAAEIAVLDTASGVHTALTAFSFDVNATTAAALDNGPPTGGGPVFAGATWFGFSSPVDPFVLPPLGAGEAFVFVYAFRFPVTLLPLAVDVQFAAGEGMADGTPVFGGEHSVQYFTVDDATVAIAPDVAVPLPGVLPALGCALAGLVLTPIAKARRCTPGPSVKTAAVNPLVVGGTARARNVRT